MKTDMIEAMLLGDSDDPFPRLGAGWRVAGFWENCAFECATEEERSSIDEQAFLG